MVAVITDVSFRNHFQRLRGLHSWYGSHGEKKIFAPAVNQIVVVWPVLTLLLTDSTSFTLFEPNVAIL